MAIPEHPELRGIQSLAYKAAARGVAGIRDFLSHISSGRSRLHRVLHSTHAVRPTKITVAKAFQFRIYMFFSILLFPVVFCANLAPKIGYLRL